MKILIVEDEAAAARQLEKLIKKLLPECSILDTIESIRGTVKWLQNNPAPDLLLMDIELSDGTSFDIFRQTPVQAPVIFTTAYNEYAIRAFKVNSIDYLLKPIDEEELKNSLNKWQTLYQHPASALPLNLDNLLQALHPTTRYKDRLLVKTHNGLKSLETSQIVYIKALDKVLYIYTFAGQVHIQDDSLEVLETTLNPDNFFRINRKYIAHINAFEKILTLPNGRIRVELQHCKDDDVFISQSRTTAFKEWLNR